MRKALLVILVAGAALLYSKKTKAATVSTQEAVVPEGYALGAVTGTVSPSAIVGNGANFEINAAGSAQAAWNAANQQDAATLVAPVDNPVVALTQSQAAANNALPATIPSQSVVLLANGKQVTLQGSLQDGGNQLGVVAADQPPINVAYSQVTRLISSPAAVAYIAPAAFNSPQPSFALDRSKYGIFVYNPNETGSDGVRGHAYASWAIYNVSLGEANRIMALRYPRGNEFATVARMGWGIPVFTSSGVVGYNELTADRGLKFTAVQA